MSNRFIYLNYPVFSTFMSLPSLKIPKEGLAIWLRVQHLPSVCKALESILGVLPPMRACLRVRVRTHAAPKTICLCMAHIQPTNLGNLKLLCFELSLQAQIKFNTSCYRLLQFFMLLLSMGPYVSPPLKPKKKGIRFTSDRLCYLLYMGQQSRCFSISWSLFASSRGMLIWN